MGLESGHIQGELDPIYKQERNHSIHPENLCFWEEEIQTR